jgi:hypothetical protein
MAPPTRAEWKAQRLGDGEFRSGYVWGMEQMSADPLNFLQDIVEPPEGPSEHYAGALRAAIEVVEEPTIRRLLESIASRRDES